MIDPSTLPNAKSADLTFWLGLAVALREAAARGLFDELAARPGKTRAQLAHALALEPSALGRLVDVLLSVGVLVEDHGALDVSAPTRKAIGGMPPRIIAELWERFPSHLTDGKPLGTLGKTGAERDEGYATAVSHLANMFRGGATLLAEHLQREEGSPTGDARYLDLGAGSGVWSLAMLAKQPGARLVAVDGKQVLRRLASFAQAKGMAERVELRAGDFFDVTLEERGYERVVLANVLHLESAPRARALVARAARALKPGGRVVVVDVLGDAPATANSSSAMRAMYALHLAMRVEGGHPHEESVLCSFLQDAGLQHIERVPLEPAPLAALVARKPA